MSACVTCVLGGIALSVLVGLISYALGKRDEARWWVAHGIVDPKLSDRAQEPAR